MCNFGGSSTNTNQIIRGQKDPNRRKLRRPMDQPTDTLMSGMGQSVTKSKTNQSRITDGMIASDTYQG